MTSGPTPATKDAKFSNLISLIESCQKDDVLTAMKEDAETSSFAMQRLCEMVESDLVADRDKRIEELGRENGELRARVEREIHKSTLLQAENDRLKKQSTDSKNSPLMRTEREILLEKLKKQAEAEMAELREQNDLLVKRL